MNSVDLFSISLDVITKTTLIFKSVCHKRNKVASVIHPMDHESFKNVIYDLPLESRVQKWLSS